MTYFDAGSGAQSGSFSNRHETSPASPCPKQSGASAGSPCHRATGQGCRPREFRALWWELLPFTELFDDVLDSHEVGLRKPNPAIYRLALERLGVEATRAVFLDDVQSNVDAATAVGLHGILVEVDPTSAVAAVRSLAGLA